MLGILSDVIRRTTFTHPVDHDRKHWDAPRFWRDETMQSRDHPRATGDRADD